MLLRKENVEMSLNISFGPQFRFPERFGQMLRRTRHLARTWVGKIAGSNSPCRDLIVDDITDLSARTMVYVAATLGLLKFLGLIAVAP